MQGCGVQGAVTGGRMVVCTLLGIMSLHVCAEGDQSNTPVTASVCLHTLTLT